MKNLLIGITAIMAVATANMANAITTLTFTNSDVDLGGASQINISDQYSAFGISVTDAYRYIDGRDPFADNFGLSNGNLGEGIPGALARIDFASNTSFFSADWWTIGSNSIFVDAYSSDGTLQGSFSGNGSGTDTIFGDISYITWHDTGGFVQLANISYDVPEPGVLALLGLGLAGLGFSRRRKHSRRSIRTLSLVS